MGTSPLHAGPEPAIVTSIGASPVRTIGRLEVAAHDDATKELRFRAEGGTDAVFAAGASPHAAFAPGVAPVGGVVDENQAAVGSLFASCEAPARLVGAGTVEGLGRIEVNVGGEWGHVCEVRIGQVCVPT